ncbi:MAG: glycogen/starch synthase, partial [Planctomycetota bacterium]
MLPLYGSLREEGREFGTAEGLADRRMAFAEDAYTWSVRTAPLPRSERADGQALEVAFLDVPELYDRKGPYTSDPDEPQRWATLCRAAIESCQLVGWAPDVFHCNDWHTGLLPLYLRHWYDWDELFKQTRSLLSIHNLGYRGDFGPEVIETLDLAEGRHLFHQEHLAEGRISLLETGILHAHWLSTVSETYAQEIQTEEHGMGLHELLQARDDHLVGIVNGIDPEEWNPSSDPHLAHHFDAQDRGGKLLAKRAILERFNLEHDPRALTIGIVSRMTGQKGFDLLPDVLPVLLEREDLRLLVLGSGEDRYVRFFQWLRDTYPTRVGVYSGYSEELAHQIEAGADLFLMPSRYEPCGLNQMYSQAYGTVPLVRATGGLTDTVVKWEPDTDEGNGFKFWEHSADALLSTLRHALEVWRSPDDWDRLVTNGMAVDNSWASRAERYDDLYRRILSESD